MTVSDAPGATTYWWLATLESIEAGLGGGSGGGPVPVVVTVGRQATVASKAFVAPATYNGATFTPPKLSGSFVVGKSAGGKVTVSLPATLLGPPPDDLGEAEDARGADRRSGARLNDRR